MITNESHGTPTPVDSSEFYIFFDTVESHLRGNEVITAINSIDTILKDFNKLFLANNYVTFHVIPPQEGSFKFSVKLVTFSISSFLLGTLAGDTIDVVFEKVTGNEKKYYIEKTLDAAVDYISGFFYTPVQELHEIIPKNINLDKSIKAKSNLFSASINDENIKQISFSNTKHFIQKSDFPKHIVDRIVRPLEPLYVDMHLQINRPILAETKGTWGFINLHDKNAINCHIEDKVFLEDFLHGKYPLKNSQFLDSIQCTVQIERELVNGEEKILSTNIIEIFQFNDVEVRKKPPTFNTKTKVYKKNKKLSHSKIIQRSLFDA